MMLAQPYKAQPLDNCRDSMGLGAVVLIKPQRPLYFEELTIDASMYMYAGSNQLIQLIPSPRPAACPFGASTE